MTIVLVPCGRGRWRKLVLEVIEGSALLFAALRDAPAEPGQVWEIQGRRWRIVEVRS